MWQDRATNNASYEVPKGSGNTVIYSGALWLGGEDVNGQLKIAALTFRQGNDFWTGPLTTSGDAEIDPDVCQEYDQFYQITRQEVSQFSAWYECSIDPQCDEADLFPGYTVPNIIQEWPAHGDPSKDQDFYLAPFYDRDGNGLYEWSKGDFPWYDIKKEAECGNDRTVRLFGDQTYWWVFNDKGNVHTETGGDPIGMEIRAQAFAFATNDEVNNMTFYNYELINRSTQTLTNTYFGQWVDSDVGCSEDDYVGCDVKRGLGYAYNADANDDEGCNGALPYGADPPAVGVDFFEGPYKDNDGIDNPGPSQSNNFFISYNDAVAGDGIVYKGMGIGYGDGVVDNERFGMRRFLYYDRLGPGWGNDPGNAIDYYRYLQGIWKDGTNFVYGGNAHFDDAAADPNLPCDYMFPGDSDPLGFGAGGAGNLFDWSEPTNSNTKGDRRFMQSAGPFVLEPGAVNNITVGVVYARAAGGLFASVEAVRLADDKAQALFDNCFEIVEGPDAPDVTIQEMDRELILYLSNTKGQSNNYVNDPEDYQIEDPFIITPDSLLAQGQQYDNVYVFQGYQIFQLKNKDVSASELDDIDLARLVAQCDIKDGVGQIVNWTFNEALGVPEPQEMVNGSDEGIKHSFRILEDQFATGDRRLINHKKYYYMAIAYGYNNYKTYDITDPLALDGQQKPYLASRKNGQGGEIKVFTGIPHIPAPEQNGTVAQSNYGDGPQITRIEGQGNGGLVLDLTPESEAAIVAGTLSPNHPTYQNGAGPVNVKVIDPLNVTDGDYRLILNRKKTLPIGTASLDSASWTLVNLTTGDTVNSEKTITVGHEQLIPEWGLSVEIAQVIYETSPGIPELLEATIEFTDSSRMWLTGVPDAEGLSNQNWIRSGTQTEDCGGPQVDGNGCDPCFYDDYVTADDDETFEGILGGTWAPYPMVGRYRSGTSNYPCVLHMPVGDDASGTVSLAGSSKLDAVNSVDIVFTSDKSKWTRCVVLEMQDDQNLAEGGTEKMHIRSAASIDKNGRQAGDAGYNAAEGDLISTTGMGWFPGYAVDLETGERLNMAYGEDSWLAVDNGRDMIFNPTSTFYSSLGQPIFGGTHYVYVFRNDRPLSTTRMPAYDNGQFAYTELDNGGSGFTKVFRSCTWVGLPMLEDGEEFLSNDVRIRLRMGKPYNIFATEGVLADSLSLSTNNWNPLYEFNTGNIATLTDVADTAHSALDLINVVPNPYYAYSQYEENRLDNLVKFTNLPERCVISIYTINGTLVRQFTKDDPLTSFDWDLRNQQAIPIASGTYIIHIKADDLESNFGDSKKRANERVIKWFGAMRPPDLDNF